MMDRMAEWPSELDLVGDVRGRGLMIGVEIVTDKKAKTQGGVERDRIVELAFERGVLLLGCGPNTHSHCATADRDQRAGGHRDGCAGRVHLASLPANPTASERRPASKSARNRPCGNQSRKARTNWSGLLRVSRRTRKTYYCT